MSEWIEWKWTPEKPYPETLETRVLTKRGKGKERSIDKTPSSVGFWFGDEDVGTVSNWNINCKEWARITHYRIAED